MKVLLLPMLCLVLSQGALAQKKDHIPFPVFSLLKMDSSSELSNRDLLDSFNTVFINFSPTCEHCQRTIKSILDNIRDFPDTQFVLSSFEDFSAIRKFYFDYLLNAYSHVLIGQEKAYSLTKQIHYSSFPCLVLFNKEKQYLSTIDQETNAKVLLKALRKKPK